MEQNKCNETPFNNRLLLLILIIFFIPLFYSCNKPKHKTSKETTQSLDYIKDNETAKYGRHFEYLKDSNIYLKVHLHYDKDSFLLVLVGKEDADKEQWDSSFWVNDIQFFKINSNKFDRIKLQSFMDSFPTGFVDLKVYNYKDIGINDFVTNKIIITDYNLDNKPDISIYSRENSGTGGDRFFTWIFNQSNDYYKFDTILSSNNIGLVDTLNKTISVWWKYGYYESVFKEYKIQGDDFKLIKQIDYSSSTDSSGQVELVEKITNY